MCFQLISFPNRMCHHQGMISHSEVQMKGVARAPLGHSAGLSFTWLSTQGLCRLDFAASPNSHDPELQHTRLPSRLPNTALAFLALLTLFSSLLCVCLVNSYSSLKAQSKCPLFCHLFILSSVCPSVPAPVPLCMICFLLSPLCSLTPSRGHRGQLQFSSVTQSCPTLCDPMDCSMPALPVPHQLPEFTQTHVH